MLGILILGMFYLQLGPKRSMNLFWGLLLVFCPFLFYFRNNEVGLTLFLFLNRLSVSAVYSAAYIANVHLFEP
jgi:hypothetical protein